MWNFVVFRLKNADNYSIIMQYNNIALIFAFVKGFFGIFSHFLFYLHFVHQIRAETNKNRKKGKNIRRRLSASGFCGKDVYII